MSNDLNTKLEIGQSHVCPWMALDTLLVGVLLGKFRIVQAVCLMGE